MRTTLMLITIGCASALPHHLTKGMRDNMQDAMISDGLDKGRFKGHPDLEAHSKFTMANISMLQLEHHHPGLKEYGAMRFEAIESGLNVVEKKIEKLLGGGYEHGHLVLEGKHKSHSVRAMVPRGKKSLDHALMLERGFWDWVSNVGSAIVSVVAPIVVAIADVVVEVATVIVDVIVEVVTVIVDVVVSAVKAVASALSSMFNAFMELLKAIAVAIMKAAINCDECVDAAVTLMSVSPGEIILKMVEWIKDYVMSRIDTGFSLERDLEKDVEMEREQNELSVWLKMKSKCYKTLYQGEIDAIKAEKTKCEERLGDGVSFKTLERSLERTGRLEREQEYSQFFKATPDCRKTSKAMSDTLKIRFDKHLNEDPSICDGLPWPKPKTFSTNLRKRSLERIEAEALERKPAEQSKSVQILDPHAPANFERSTAGLTIAALFADIKPALQSFMVVANSVISGTRSQSSSSCGCGDCPCKPVACFSFTLEASAAIQFVSVGVGGELGYCVAADGTDTAFVAIGGGLSLGVGHAPGDLSGGLSLTVLRNMGDVAGHALSAGFSVGDYSLAAVWAIAGDSDWTDSNGKSDDAVEKTSAEEFLDDMMSTAFVGIVVSKSITLKELAAGKYLTGGAGSSGGVGSSGELGLSVDFGYGFGWELETGFNGVGPSTEVEQTSSTSACSATCRVDEGERAHRCDSSADCQGAQRTCSSYGWCQGADNGNDCCTTAPPETCYDGPCKSCKINCA